MMGLPRPEASGAASSILQEQSSTSGLHSIPCESALATGMSGCFSHCFSQVPDSNVRYVENGTTKVRSVTSGMLGTATEANKERRSQGTCTVHVLVERYDHCYWLAHRLDTKNKTLPCLGYFAAFIPTPLHQFRNGFIVVKKQMRVV